MTRIAPVNRANAEPGTEKLLQGIEKKMGGVPNILATMANSTATAGAYLGMSQALAGGELGPRIREQIALSVGELNGCEYCVSAHTMLGKNAGLNDYELDLARRGRADDARTDAALRFARQIVDVRGHVSDEALADVRSAGFSEGEITEIIANVALNLFTNYFNHVADTAIDFPKVDSLAAA